MKPKLRSTQSWPCGLIATLVLTLVAASGLSVKAASYTVNLEPLRFDSLVNHLAPMPLQTLIPNASQESLVVFMQTPNMGAQETYIFDGVTWLDNDTADPTSRVVGTGEGFVFYNGSTVPSSLTFTGPTAAPVLPLTFTPGVWRHVGRQDIGLGTFANITGYPPSGCPGVEVYRYLTATGLYDLHTYGMSGWTPPLPVLNVGEAVWIRVTGPCSGTPPFDVQAIHPSVAAATCTATLQIVGSDFQAGATVTLKKTGEVDIVGGSPTVISGGYGLSASFNLIGAALGAWDVEVVNFGGATKTLSAALTVAPTSVAAVTPTSSGSCSSVMITAYGTAICPGSTVKLVKTGEADITGTSLVVAADQQSISGNFNVNGAAGGAWDLVITDPASVTVTLSSAFHVVPTSVTSALPSSAANCSVLAITANGAGICPGSTVKLVKTGETDIVGASPIVAPGGNSISASFNLNGAAVGPWDVVVTDPGNASVTLAGGVLLQVPALTAVVPSEIGNCGQVTLNLAGTALSPSMTIKLARTGYADIPGTHALVSPFGLGFAETFNLAGAASGLWDVVLTCSAGTWTLPNAVTVSPIAISLVQPVSGTACAAKTVSIQGYCFAPGATVRLKKSGEADIVGSPVNFVSSFALTTTVNLTSAVSGAWDIEVTNLGGATATLVNGFTVFPCNPCDLEVKMLSPSRVAAGRPVNYTLQYKNLNNNSAIGPVNLCVHGIPHDAVIGLPNTPAATITGSGNSPKSICFTVPSLAPGQSGTFIFTLVIPSIRPPVQLHAQSTSPCQSDDIGQTEIVASHDPNDKIGHEGVGPERYLIGSETLPYTVTFENKPSATAPAQEVFITDYVDPAKLDLATFRFGPVTFGSVTFTPTPNSTHFVSYQPYDVDGNSLNTADDILVKIEGNLDTALLSPTRGQITWALRSIDPATGQLPLDPLRGFLPPNVTAPAGEGRVEYSVKPLPGLLSGDYFGNDARIVFDLNPPILTPAWINFIDKDAPRSSVTALPASQTTPAFTVEWSGTDDHSGMASYDVYVSDDNGPYTQWQSGTTALSAVFNGQVNHAYRFYSVGVDNVGHREAAPAAPDAETMVQAPGVSYELMVPTGFSLIANHLDRGGNTLNEILPNVPTESLIFKWDWASESFVEPAVFDGTAWIDFFGNPSTLTLAPGEGAFLYNSESPLTLTFTGTPHEPVLPPPLAGGCGFTNLLSRQIMAPGPFEPVTGFLPVEGAQVRRFSSGSYNDYTFVDGAWEPAEPILAIGESAFYVVPCLAPPITMSCPSNIVLTARTNIEVCYSPEPSATGGEGPLTIVTTPPSCSLFAPGTTNTVTCVATDARGRSNACTFLVIVLQGRTDLMIEDTPVAYFGVPDSGEEPDVNMNGQSVWSSRGLWVHEDCLQPAGDYLTHQNPRFGLQNCMMAQVRNRGNMPVVGAKVEMWFANASLGLSWPAQWKQIGTYTLPPLQPGETHVAQAPWFPPGTGHYCLIARIISDVDPMTVAEGVNIQANVRANNNIAWRNVNVADCLVAPGRKVEVRVRNFEPAPKLLSLIFTADQEFLATGGEAILHPGAELFARWQAAGARGENVTVINENQIRFTGSPARLDGIPFGAEEERIFNLTLAAGAPMPVPGTSHVYHASLQQALDGQIVGGVDYVIMTRALDTDTDKDGVPDVTDPDDDGDGVPDTEDPSPAGESDCPPAAISVGRSGDVITLIWSGLGYRLQGTADFSQWDDLPASVSPAALRADTPYRFFRLICQ